MIVDIIIITLVIIQDMLENDYDSMREMIVGEPPEFSIILDKLKELESILNKK